MQVSPPPVAAKWYEESGCDYDKEENFCRNFFKTASGF
jgi:hypothetical protein